MPTLLTGPDLAEGLRWMKEAAEEAETSICQKAHRGVVMVLNGILIGMGTNGPPPGFLCFPEYCKPICSTYCIHAENNAIFDAFKKKYNPQGARMYHARVEKGIIQNSRLPRCPDCSKHILALGIQDFVLQHEEGLTVYTARELHEMGLASLVKDSPPKTI